MPTGTAPATVNDLWYQGGRQDSSSGQYDYGARTYDPTTASWLTPDTYRTGNPGQNLSVGTDPLTANSYRYVNGDPVNASDPSGHEPRPNHEGIRSGRRPRRTWSANDAGSSRIQVAERQAEQGIIGGAGGPTEWERAVFLFNYETNPDTPDYLRRHDHTHNIPWIGFTGIDPCEVLWHGEQTCNAVIEKAMDLGYLKHDGIAILLDYDDHSEQWDQLYSDIGVYMEALALVATARPGLFRTSGSGLSSVNSTTQSLFDSLAYSSHGVQPYRAHAAVTAGKRGTIQAHHLVEQRFANVIGGSTDDWASIIVTRAEHNSFTQAWRQQIPYGAGTRSATRNQINAAAREVYRDYPELLRALGLGG